ncbi:MAG: hypothetical protein REI64_13615 [Pedobacter sp.]|uniref:hypothetical protein n=1 Tax=Pedobacter sp. TaxID=1411316 RepID=UPI0028084A0B|nr:hypothetical protein [Pedobacter sp.]MDQ8005836.1 hypothetical protein [Pedobacter sp.]
MRITLKHVLLSFLYLKTTTVLFAQETQIDTIRKISPAYQQFYAKLLYNESIPIRSSIAVSDSALIVASEKMTMMLKYTENVRKNLITNGAEFHIIGKNEQTSDLPEFRHMKGVSYQDHGITTDIDKRTRGMGGIYASCGEENLLKLPLDQYAGYDIFVHEFAHTFMDFGIDSNLRQKIVHQYKTSIGSGLWKGVYAASNAQEYWAELSSWYFGAHGDMLPNRMSSPGRAWLRKYDPKGYSLLDSIYSGKLESGLIEKKSHLVAKGTPSGKSNKAAKLAIINDSNKKLMISKIDQNGTAVFFAEVLPSTSLFEDTFYTSVWLIDDGKMQFYLQVHDPLCKMEFSRAY